MDQWREPPTPPPGEYCWECSLPPQTPVPWCGKDSHSKLTIPDPIWAQNPDGTLCRPTLSEECPNLTKLQRQWGKVHGQGVHREASCCHEHHGRVSIATEGLVLELLRDSMAGYPTAWSKRIVFFYGDDIECFAFVGAKRIGKGRGATHLAALLDTLLEAPCTQ